MRTATSLAVDRHQTAFALGIRGENPGRPRPKTFPEGLGPEHHEQPAEAIPRRQSVRQGQAIFQSLFMKGGPAMNRGAPVKAADDPAHRNDDNIDQQMFAIASMPGIFRRLKISADRTDIDEFRHA